MAPQIIFIASLARSGSTLLSLLLGGHDRITTFGEASRTIQLIQEGTSYREVPEFGERSCTCGENSSNCPIWGEVYDSFNSGEWSTTREGYEKLLDEVESYYGDNQMVVDSSKGLAYLETLSHDIDGNVTPIYLVRDVRSWTMSMQKNWSSGSVDKFADLNIPRYILKYLLHTTPGSILRWYIRNIKMKESLHNYDYFQVGYEELCLQSEQILELIADWLGVEFIRDMKTPTSGNHHLIRGNRMKHDQDKLSGIYYDNRWFYSRRQQALGWMYIPVFQWNLENVYNNLKGKRAGTSIHVTDVDEP